MLVDHLLGTGDSEAASRYWTRSRRRPLTALINGATLAQTEPTVSSSETIWIDDRGQSMLADFIAVIPPVPSLMLDHLRPGTEVR